MRILDNVIHEAREYTNKKKKQIPYKEFTAINSLPWPKAENNSIVLLPDLAVELGSPDVASVSFQAFTDDKSLVNDGKITLIGPDVNTGVSKLPFGKIVIIGVNGFDENNAFERNRELFLSKFDLSLKGFMLKSASSYMAEWCRISKEAAQNNFSLEFTGSALINNLKKLDYVESAEIVFITSSDDDVNELYEIGSRAVRTVKALSKMVDEMSYDCGECEYQDICDDADELRKLRDSLAEK